MLKKDTFIINENFQLIQCKNDESVVPRYLLLQSVRVIKYEMCKNNF